MFELFFFHLGGGDVGVLGMIFFFKFSLRVEFNSIHRLYRKCFKYCLLRSYKKGCFFLLLYVFFNVESESEVRFGRSPLFFEL